MRNDTTLTMQHGDLTTILPIAPKDTVYLYDVYSPLYDENFILASKVPLTKSGTTLFLDKVSDTPHVAQVLREYHEPTSRRMEHTIMVELGLLVLVLITLFILCIWLWRQLYKQDKRLMVLKG